MRMFIQTFLKDIKDPRDVFGLLQPLFLISTILGIMPLRIRGDSKVRWLDTCAFTNSCLIFRIILLICCFIFAFTRCDFILSYFFLSSMSKFSDLLQKMNGMIGSVLALVIALVYKSELKTCIDILAEIGYRCEVYEMNVKFMRIILKIWGLMVTPCVLNFGFMFYTVFGILTRHGIYPYTAECIAFFIPNLILTTIGMKFVALLLVISEYQDILHKVR